MAIVKYNKRYPTMSRILHNDLPNLFEDFLGSDWGFDIMKGDYNMPQTNIREEDNSYIIELASPGREKKDFDITLKDGVLSIKGKKKDSKQESNGKYYKREISYLSFEKTFDLGDETDSSNISANYKDGILSIVVPKKEEASSKSSINIDIQ